MASKKKHKKQQLEKEQSSVERKQSTAGIEKKHAVTWKVYAVVFVIIMLLSFLLYRVALSHEYALDDEIVITKNVYVQEGKNALGDIFSHDSFMGYFQNEDNLYLLPGGRYRPLSLAGFALEVEWFGAGKPSISHGINIFLYALTGFLLFVVLIRLFQLKENKQWLLSIPFLTAIIWIMHPLHTEVVANIKGRDEILSLLFSLAALWSSFLYIDKHKNRWWILSVVFLFFAMLAKENALTFMAIIPLSIWFFRKVSFSQLVKVCMPMLIAAVVFIFIRYQALGFFFNHGRPVTDIMNDPFIGMSSTERYATTFYTLGWYIKLMVLPFPLTHDYYPYQVPVVNWTNGIAILSVVFYLLMGFIASKQLKKKTITAYSILFYLATLSMASNIFFTVGTFMNERFLYMPSVAFALWISWLLVQYLPQKMNMPFIKWAGVTMLSVMGIFFCWKTIERVPDWKNGDTLNASAIKFSPNSARANCFYAVSVYQRYAAEKDTAVKNRMADTLEHYINRSLEILPGYSAALQMKIGIVAARFQKDGNIDLLYQEFEDIMKQVPRNKECRPYLISYLKYLQGRYPEKTAAFCYRLGYEFYFKKERDAPMAVDILEQGRLNMPADKNLLNALVEVYRAAGNNQKAAEIQSVLHMNQ